jgi:hypothetical protein
MLPGEHHPMLIRVHLDHITFLDRAVAAVEDEIGAALDTIPAAWGISADGVPSPDPGPGAAALTAVERLAEIPGVSPALAPIARQSGPRNRKPKKGQGDACLKGYCSAPRSRAAEPSRSAMVDWRQQYL